MKLLLYCTKKKPDLTITTNYFGKANGKIVAECDYEVEKIKRINTVGDWFYYEKQDEILEKSCIIDVNKFFEYLQGEDGYAIHIKNLHIFDEPLSLFEISKECHYSYKEYLPKYFNAPQNICYCWYKGEKCALISIRPEWLCKILNGEKTIEIRKKVLKGMLKDE